MLVVFTLFFPSPLTVPSTMCGTIASQDSFVRDIGKVHYILQTSYGHFFFEFMSCDRLMLPCDLALTSQLFVICTVL